MNGSCDAACFSPDDRYLFTAGDQAEVYQWDLRMRRCLHKLADEGSFSTTCIDVSPNGRFLATGSKMGTVNVYSINENFEEQFGVPAGDDSKLKSTLFSKGQKPEKTVMNLTTAVTDLKFGPTSEVLAYCSKWKKNALRLVHIPSFTAY